MAYLETWHICPVCNQKYDEYEQALKCRNQHPIGSELWAVGKYKAVRVFVSYAAMSVGSKEWALKEADLSDNISQRK